MENYLSLANYVLFGILYVTCFWFIYKKNAETVALTCLTILQIGFTLFIGKEILIDDNITGTGSMMLLYGVLGSSLLMSIALLLLIITLVSVQQKHTNVRGTPVILPPNYQSLYDSLKRNTIILMALISIGLLSYYLYSSQMNGPISSRFVIGTIILSLIITTLSILQVSKSSKFTQLEKDNLVGK